MPIPLGTTHYSLGCHPVTGTGVSLTAPDLEQALAGPVHDVAYDVDATNDLASLLEGLIETDFQREGVERILVGKQAVPESWRVGEALAEVYLSHHFACTFPWPDGRDERKSGSSLPGADLVGFQQIEDNDDRFVFGEVKTSEEDTYPPGVMHGRGGLKQQLEDLKDDVQIRNDLVKYLGHRAVSASWKDRFINASRHYLADTSDVSVFGLLVRDVPPHADDLRVRTDKLAQACPEKMTIALTALYLPEGSIASLGQKVQTFHRGGAMP